MILHHFAILRVQAVLFYPCCLWIFAARRALCGTAPIRSGGCAHGAAKPAILCIFGGCGCRLPAFAGAHAAGVSAGGFVGVLCAGHAGHAAGHHCTGGVHLPVRPRPCLAGRRTQNRLFALWRDRYAGHSGLFKYNGLLGGVLHGWRAVAMPLGISFTSLPQSPT